MSDVGFDGKVRRRPPSMVAWLGASLLLSAIYWLALAFLAPKLFLVALTPDANGPLSALEALSNFAPLLLSLLLAGPFRLWEADIFSWILLVFAASLAVGLGFGVVVLLLPLL
jgi:hypothetical protein